MNEPRKENCETCRFWVSAECTMLAMIGWGDARDGNCGFCHRYPPQTITKEEPPEYPLVDDDDWCGEWLPVGPDVRTAKDL